MTLRELNRATLARQLLLRRRRLTVSQALERVAGIQAQWPPSPYIGLWTRTDAFRPQQLMRAVRRRRVVRATLMRTTLHLVTSPDYLAYAGLYRQIRVRDLQRQLERLGAAHSLREESERLAALAGEKPRKRPELLAELGLPKLHIEERAPWLLWYGLAAQAGLVNGPESSVWRSHTAGTTYVSARSWLGADGASGAAATTHLVRRYLAAFGPASRADIAKWSGLARGHVDQGLDGLALRRFRDELGRELYDLPRASLPPPETPAPVRLLPRFDNLVLGHDDRRRVLPAEYRSQVIEGGEVRPTFLVDGFVAGTWSLEDGRVRLRLFAPLPRSARRELEEETARLEAFVRAAEGA